MTNILKLSENHITFSSELQNLNPNEFEALIGLTLFLKGENPYSKNPDPNISHPGGFCHNANGLFEGLDSFLMGRFKCDSHMSTLSSLFKKAIKEAPHLGENYFYAYSELMQLLTAIYNAQPLIEHLSGLLCHLAEKEEYFEIDSISPNNETNNLPKHI